MAYGEREANTMRLLGDVAVGMATRVEELAAVIKEDRLVGMAEAMTRRATLMGAVIVGPTPTSRRARRRI